MNSSGVLKSSSSELDLDRPNIEDYLPSGAAIQQEPRGKLRLYVFSLPYSVCFYSGVLVVILISPVFCFLLDFFFFRHDLLDISPTLSEAAGAIVDVNYSRIFYSSLFYCL